jgi:hypothetical protein
MRRRLLVLAPTLGSLVGLVLVVAPAARVPSATTPPPVQISSQSVTAPSAAMAPGWSRVVTGATNLVGVRWQGDPNARFTISTQDRDGRWSNAGDVGVPDGGPDPQSREGRRARPGNVSEPVWVGDATAVRIRVATGAARGVDVEKVVVPPAPVSTGVAGAAAPQPAIISRAQWGADERLRLTNCPGGPDYDANVNLAIVHHTGGSNNYGPGDSPAIMRGLYAYATQTLQYCDIHYNFLVDKYGQVFEGRYGGIREAVHGAHSIGFNTDTTGIAAIGNFQVTPAPPVMVSAIERLIAWKFDVHGVNPTTPVTYVTAGNDKFPAGTAVTVPRIIGHQDTWFTDCPGQFLEPLLPSMRAAVAGMMASNRRWSDLGVFPGPVTSAAASASWATNRIDLFGVANGSLVHKWGDGDRWSNGWEDLGAPSGGIVGSPTAVSWGPNRVDVFVTGADGTLRHKWWYGGWSPWESLGGHLVSSPSVASWGPDRLDVFGTGPGGVLVHKWWENAWSGWESLGGGVVGDPAVVSWGKPRIDVFVRGTDNAMWHRWYAGYWAGWEGLGGVLTSAPSAASWEPERIDVFVRGTDLGLYHRWWGGGRWWGYEPLHGRLQNKPSAVSKSWNRIDVFTPDPGGLVRHGTWG